MGGFLLLKKGLNTSAKTKESYRDSIEVFHKKKLQLLKELDREEFTLMIFQKYSLDAESLIEFDNGDFVAFTGTCIYKGKTGRKALESLYADFVNGKNVHNNLNGMYAVLIFHKKQLHIFNDFTGHYRIYYRNSGEVVSNSFLALSASLKEKRLSTQELYEYLFNGAFYGRQTLFEEISSLDGEMAMNFLPTITESRKSLDGLGLQDNMSFDEMVRQVSDAQVEYFDMLKGAFQNNHFAAGLSGGYDSRLILGLCRKVGIDPKLHVYGNDESSDVIIANEIAQNENLKITQFDKDAFPDPQVEEFRDVIDTNLYFFDGLGAHGVFDNGAEIHSRKELTKSSQVMLYGCGGEIYRNVWRLPNRAFSVKDFLRSFYDRYDYSICTDQFEQTLYFSNFAKKVKDLLGFSGNKIPRQKIDRLFPLLRLRHWYSLNHSPLNQYSFILSPFSEPVFTHQSFDIPMKYKENGLFEAALIRSCDIALSKYSSNYGHDFYSPLSVKTKVKNKVTINIPTSIRPAIRKKFINHESHLSPNIFQDDYMKAIFGSEELAISKYIDINQITDRSMLSRALSVELLLRGSIS